MHPPHPPRRAHPPGRPRHRRGHLDAADLGPAGRDHLQSLRQPPHLRLPVCAETYRRDAFQLIRAGLVGGKGVPEHVATHPAVFATFTAPSFGPVHTRPVRLHTCTGKAHCRCQAQPCHARREAEVCPHGRKLACFNRHARDDARLGQPLCPDCYDHAGHVVWNNTAGELWRRTKQAIERHLNQLARHRRLPYGVRVSHGKAAEYQARGAVHFHVLLRLDGLDPADPARLLPPPPGITAADLEDATRHAAATITCLTGPHPASPPAGSSRWGGELDVRAITLRATGTITDLMVASYLAKYSTKGTEVTGHTSSGSPRPPSACTPKPTAPTPNGSSMPAGSSAPTRATRACSGGRTCSASAATSSPKAATTPSPSPPCAPPASPTGAPRTPAPNTSPSAPPTTPR